jgi:serine/threonine kinase 16
MRELLLKILTIIMRSISAMASHLHTLMRSFVASLSPKQTIKVNNKTYTIQRKLGEGGFSFVYLVRGSSDSYALKRIRIALPEHEDRLKGEIESHSVISPYIIKLVDYEIVMDGRRMVEGLLLLPFYAGGTVQDLIDANKKNGTKVSLKHLLMISIDVCKGLLAFQYGCRFDID